MEQFAYYDTSLGLIKIGCQSDTITCVQLVSKPESASCPCALSDQTAQALIEYLNGTRTSFKLPLFPSGTAFQRSVWQHLQSIPYGETRTYGQIAQALGKPTAARAVGQACNRNPIWILIPCHRVVGAGQKLTGYAGGLGIKQKLLALEQRYTPDA